MFRNKAAKVEKALKEAGFTVSVNPEKPRKGSFVITIDSNPEPEVEFLDLPRPFKKLREFDLDQAIADIIAKNE